MFLVMRRCPIILIAGLILVSIAGSTQPSVDYIERAYYKEAQAQNEALSAARYAEEAYFYSHQANNRSDLNDYRADLDTVLFYLKKANQLADSALVSMSPNDTIEAYLYRGQKLIDEVDGVLRHVYPFTKLEVMKQYSDYMLTNLMNAKIDYFTASLHLSDGNMELNDEFVYEELDLDEHVARLDADESAFTDLVLDLEDKLKALNERIEALREKIAQTTDPDERTALEKELAALLAERDQLMSTLQKANDRLQTIRDQQQQRMEGDDLAAGTEANAGVDEQFETDKHGYYDDKDVSVNEPLPKGLVYRIQLGYFFKTDSQDAFHGLFPITGEDLGDGKIRYYAGMFNSYKDASRAKSYIRDKRIGDAFVVPYLDGQKINVKRAIEVERQLKSGR